MKKYWKTIIVITILAALGIGYYYYLANRTIPKDATQMAVNNEELAALTAKDLEKNYPESVRDVIKLYARITKAYYENNLSEEDIEKLGRQARILFDDELKSTQTDKEFLDALKEDVTNYKKNKMYISNYAIQISTKTKYTSLNNSEYASLCLVYYIRVGDELKNSYTKFTLRKDSAGRWKILYWELVDQVELE
ncbi:MAG: hypothetical protein Q4F06_10185 [Eubacteriales bacterium]|nr:hypothetical protein [Eubacteriales bacterium]